MAELISWLTDRISIILGFESIELAQSFVDAAKIGGLDGLKQAATSMLGDTPETTALCEEVMARMQATTAAAPARPVPSSATPEPPVPAPADAPPAKSDRGLDADLRALEAGVKRTKGKKGKQGGKGKAGSSTAAPAAAAASAAKPEVNIAVHYGAGDATDALRTTQDAQHITTAVRAAGRAEAAAAAEFAGARSSRPSAAAASAGRAGAGATQWGTLVEAPSAPAWLPAGSGSVTEHGRWIATVPGQVFGPHQDQAGVHVEASGTAHDVSISRGQYCPCMGSVHEPLGNCTECGKIICALEAGKLCSFCGEPMAFAAGLGREAINKARKEALEGVGAEAAAELRAEGARAVFRALGDSDAMRRKEKLLRYDAQDVSRSAVYDDQADYWADSSSAFLSQEEREAAAAADAQRRAAMHERRQQRLNIMLSQGGLRVEAEQTADQAALANAFGLGAAAGGPDAISIGQLGSQPAAASTGARSVFTSDAGALLDMGHAAASATGGGQPLNAADVWSDINSQLRQQQSAAASQHRPGSLTPALRTAAQHDDPLAGLGVAGAQGSAAAQQAAVAGALPPDFWTVPLHPRRYAAACEGKLLPPATAADVAGARALAAAKRSAAAAC